MKKIISIVCLMLALATLLCSCNDESAETPVTNDSVAETSAEETTAPTETTAAPQKIEKPDPCVDLDGEITVTSTPIDYVQISAFNSVAGGGFKYTWVQGGCVGGQYLYTCMIANNSVIWPEKGCIIKTDLDTGLMEAQSGEVAFGHMNDATYNPDKNEIVISNCTQGDVLHILDADTLKTKKTVALASGVYAITYDPYTRQYVGIDGSYIYYFNASFKFIKRASYKPTDKYAGQGITSDGTYLYRLEYYQNPNDHSEITNNLVIHDLATGAMIKKLDLGINCETENIGIRDGKFYISCNNRGWNGLALFEVEITTQK